MSTTPAKTPARTLGTGQIFISAVALVVSASTLVGDFTGFARLGLVFALAVAVGLLVVIPVVVSTCDLAVGEPTAGGIYRYVRTVVRGRLGRAAAYYAALLFTGTFLFGAAGETVSGAHALCALTGDALPLEAGVVAIGLAAIGPNLLGLRWATALTTGLLALMLGLRWFFAFAGFFGWGDTGPWAWANLVATGAPGALRWTEVLTQGLALGFWCFVGVEGACALAAETRRPERSLPRGLLLALAAIFATTLVTGIGTLGGRPLAEWQVLLASAEGAGGEAPHLAVGAALFGEPGRRLMAVATLASTLSTLLVAFAAMPRMLQALGRDRLPPPGAARLLGGWTSRSGAPRGATVVLGAAYFAVTLAWGAVVDCLYAAAYLWFVRHAVLHGLAAWRRLRSRAAPGAFGRRWVVANAVAGLGLTFSAFAVSFAGRHGQYGSRALGVAVGAGLLVALSWLLRRAAVSRRRRAAERREMAAVAAERVWT